MGSQLFTTTGANTWNWPAGVTSVTVELIGGGGAGGGATGNPAAGGGGKGGGYSKKLISKGVESSLTITVGTGGVGGTTANGASAAVSTTTQNGSIVQTANAGVSAAANQTTTTGAGSTTVIGTASGDTTFSGGNGATASTSSGAGGGAAGPTSAGGNGSGTTAGTRGTGTWGDGSTTRSGTGAAGVAASAVGASPVVGTVGYGGGGSGGAAGTATDRAGGNGAQGVALLTWTDPVVTLSQTAFRLYSDGTESGASALAAQSTNASVNIGGGDVIALIRLRLQETAAGAGNSTDGYEIYCSKNGGTYLPISAIVDSYSSTAWLTGEMSGSNLAVMQSFTPSVTGALLRAKLPVTKAGTAPGTLTCKLYQLASNSASALPTSALATGTQVYSNSDVTTSPTDLWYDFDGTVTLTAGQWYGIGFELSTGGASGNCYLLVGNTAGAHAGKWEIKVGTTWQDAGAPNTDISFEVHSIDSTLSVVPIDSSNLTDGGATTNQLGAGTGSFYAGKVGEVSSVRSFAAQASNYTELLYSVKLIASNLVATDTLDFRVYRNGVAIGTYSVTPRITITNVPTIHRLTTLGAG